ncbi:MAG TPA: response regulator transcription factor [Anaerolineaceae bacterium]|nr:response regulator transcription factor [Anaerolineaceae bacterium]
MVRSEKKAVSTGNPGKELANRSRNHKKTPDPRAAAPGRVVVGGPIGLMIVDSSQAFREGLASALRDHKEFELVGQLELADQVFAQEESLNADICIVDVDLRDRSGIEVMHWLRDKYPHTTVLLLSHWDWDVYLVAAQVAGAVGLLIRSTPLEVLFRQINSAYLGPIYTPGQIHRIKTWKKTVGDRLKKLSPREWEILWLLAMGHKNKLIAESLSLAENTVEKHVTNILEKVGLTSRSSLLAFIYLNHLDVLSRLPVSRRFLYINLVEETAEVSEQ